MRHDEGGLLDALVFRAFYHYQAMIPDWVWYSIVLAVPVLVVALILLWAAHATNIAAIAETSTDQSLVD